jgi:hypothetical protein
MILLSAIILGKVRQHQGGPHERAAGTVSLSVPFLGPVQVLNGCGAVGAGDRMADFLRARKFDVKNIGNAPEKNYPYTLVISRLKDTTIAHQIHDSLHAGACMLLRNGDTTYTVTVIIGADYSDYKERIQ